MSTLASSLANFFNSLKRCSSNSLIVVPARALSNPVASIFTPHAASTESTDSHLSPASRISAMPFGLFRPFILIPKGPSTPARTSLSPLFSTPLYRITSIGFDIPTSSFISNMVPSAGPIVSVNLSSRNLSARPTSTTSAS